MSVFETSNHEDGDNQNDEKTNWLDKVVEAKGEKWKDPAEIAKGYIHAQKLIDDQAEELEALRKEKEKGAWTNEVLSQLNQRQPASEVNGSVKAGTSEKETPSEPSEKDIKGLIRDALTEQEKARTSEQNRSSVEEGLRTLYGTEATEKLKDKAKEIGMSVKRLQDIAEESPTAFFQLIGEPHQKESNEVPKNTVNTNSGFNQSQRKNWAYYQKLRRENPKLYRSPQVQSEVLTERKKQGDSFYS